MQDTPDVQNYDAPHPIALTKVGVRGVRKPVVVKRPRADKPSTLVAEFDLFVDLPADQKGTHMSRNVEALANVLDDEEIQTESGSLEIVCNQLAKRLLEKHGYAKVAYVDAKAHYFLPRVNPGGKPTIEAFMLYAYAVIDREGNSSRRVGVGVTGMSACPCAMETARAKYAAEGREPPADLPFITHNQRNNVVLRIDIPEGFDVEAADLVKLAEESLSAPTYELLKRSDEGDLVIQAHKNPKFVEDVVRDCLHFTANAYSSFPKGTKIFVSSEAEESIHKHNAYAECEATIGDLL